MYEKPNILFFFTDMQRADTIHALGNPVIKTPNLDRLVKEGTAFTNCYSPSPVCIPARCCMQYGLYPQKTGLFVNGVMPEDNGASYPAILGENGYKTHAIGKCHFTPEPLEMRGFQSRLTQEEIIDPEKDDYKKFLTKNGYSNVEPHGSRSEMYYIPQISTLPAEVHPTQWIGDRSIDFIEENSSDKKPWMLFSSFIHPHPPLAPPKPWHKLYRTPKMPYPNVPDESESLQTYINRFQNRYKYRDQGIDKNLVRTIKAFYYATISFVDYQIGRVVDSLEKTGQLENTIIIFSSDHGEYLGDYNCFGKRSMHDASSKVPLIARYPKRFAKNKICATPVSLIDIMPTILAAAKIDTSEIELDGKDLSKTAVEKTDREVVFSQHGSGQKGIYMVVSKDHKYFYSAADDKEFLFDKNSDPQETHNCAGNPFYKNEQEKLKNILLEYLKSTNITDAFEEKITL
jgi:choline-sulfatase